VTINNQKRVELQYKKSLCSKLFCKVFYFYKFALFSSFLYFTDKLWPKLRLKLAFLEAIEAKKCLHLSNYARKAKGFCNLLLKDVTGVFGLLTLKYILSLTMNY